MRLGVRKGSLIRQTMIRVVRKERLAKIDYLAVCDPNTLEPLDRITRRAVLLGAIRVGQVRLIDNLLIRGPQPGK